MADQLNVWDTASENAKRWPDRDFTNPDNCVLCGLPCSVNKRIAIEIALDGTVIPEGDPRSEGDESQGWWTIGRECVKRMQP